MEFFKFGNAVDSVYGDVVFVQCFSTRSWLTEAGE